MEIEMEMENAKHVQPKDYNNAENKIKLLLSLVGRGLCFRFWAGPSCLSLFLAMTKSLSRSLTEFNILQLLRVHFQQINLTKFNLPAVVVEMDVDVDVC